MSFANPQVAGDHIFISDMAYDLNNGTLDLPAFPDVTMQIKSAPGRTYNGTTYMPLDNST